MTRSSCSCWCLWTLGYRLLSRRARRPGVSRELDQQSWVPIRRSFSLGLVGRIYLNGLLQVLHIHRERSYHNAQRRFDQRPLPFFLDWILAAGHRTTSSTLTSAIVTLSQPKLYYLQEVVWAEIRDNLPSLSSSKLAFPTGVANMPYLNALINKILRLLYQSSKEMINEALRTMTHQIPHLQPPLSVSRAPNKVKIIRTTVQMTKIQDSETST